MRTSTPVSASDEVTLAAQLIREEHIGYLVVRKGTRRMARNALSECSSTATSSSASLPVGLILAACAWRTS